MQNRLVFFLIVIAVILAIAGFLLVSFLTRGSEMADANTTPGIQPGDNGGNGPVGVPLQIDNTTVYLNPRPERAVSVRTELQPPPTEPTQAVIVPTPQPTLVTILPTIPVVTPTSPPQQQAPTAGGQMITFINYVVQPGDTLYRITEKQATSIELMAVHGISSTNLVPGTTLRLPVANPAYCSGGATVYVVRPGDTVFRVAQKFNTTAQAIASANNLGADYRIDIATVLCIP